MTVRLVVGATLLGALVLPRPARALDPDTPLNACTVEVWGARRGLPSSYVRALSQTPDGYLWIAGYGAVARYDGARIVALPEPGPQPRIFDTQRLKVDRQGTLWLIPSKGTPVCAREGVARDCLPAAIRLPQGERLVDAHPEADGSAWLASRTGLLRYQPGPPPRLTPVATPALGRITFVHRDRRGRLWLGSEAGLYRAGDDGSFALATSETGPVTAPARFVFETPQGRLWFLLDRGLLRVDGDQGRTFTARDGVPHTKGSEVLEDRDGNVWVGTHHGLARFRDGRWVTFTTRDGLPDDDVTALHEDREGSLWVGTRRGGIAQFTDRVVVTRAAPPSVRDVLQRVATICQDRRGALWFGTSSGLLRWDGAEERRYTTRDGLPDDEVLAAAPGPDGEVWVGTANGLARVSADGRVDVPGPAGGKVTAFHVDGDGAVWIGNAGRLLRFRAGRLEQMAPPLDTEIRAIESDRGGRIWIAGSVGLVRMEGDRPVRVKLPGGGHTGRSLHRDREGRLWLVTGTDIARLDPAPIRFLGRTAGLEGRQLFQMIDDDRGHFWLSTSRGLLRLPKARVAALADGAPVSIDPLSLESDDRRRDIIGNNTRDPGVWRDNTGRLWFATDQGALMIDPARLRVNEHPPTIRIDEATADARTLLRGVRNELRPGPGNLAFRFSAVTLLEPHKSLHRYRLEGFDDAWVDAGARRVAYYTNIPPGNYRFRVQGSNADGVWNQEGDMVELRLLPHFYKTGWFYAGASLAALAALVLVWRQRVRGLRRGYLAALAERSRVARELHDTLLQGMSAVGLKLRALRRRPDAPAFAGELAALEGLVTATLQETREVLGDLRGQSASGDLAVALERLAGRLTEGHALACTVVVDGATPPLPDETKGALFRIAQEAIHNAVKHARARRIEVSLRYHAGVAALTVADDGCGFDQAGAAGAADGHFGLVGMRERAARVGALRLTSDPGRGTTVEVTVPLAGAEGARG